jgi:hypothetical protein
MRSKRTEQTRTVATRGRIIVVAMLHNSIHCLKLFTLHYMELKLKIVFSAGCCVFFSSLLYYYHYYTLCLISCRESTISIIYFLICSILINCHELMLVIFLSIFSAYKYITIDSFFEAYYKQK